MYNITYNNKQVTNNHNLKLYKNSTEKIQQTIISKINNELLVKIYIKTTLNNMFITYNFNNKIITKSIAALGFKGKTKQTQYAYKTFAENLINELYPDGIDATTLNDILWFEDQWIFEALNIEIEEE